MKKAINRVQILLSVKKCYESYIRSKDIEVTYNIILREFLTLTESNVGFIGTIRDKEIVYKAFSGFKIGLPIKHEYILSQILQGKKIDRLPENMPYNHISLKSVFICPLKYNEEVIGILAAGNGIYDEYDEFCDMAARIIENYRFNESEADRKRIEHANLAKNEFMANISHEIRSPLHGILGMLALLKDSELNSRQKDCVDIMEKSSLTLMSIINDILDLSKLEAGKMTIKPSPIDIREYIDICYNIYANEILEKKLNFAVKISEEVPEIIICDGQRVKQIVVNLLSNAIKFTDKGDIRINISVSSDKLDPYPLEDIYDGKIGKAISLQVAVSDTGIGIRTEDIQKLFRAFAQLDKGVSKSYQGTGLGLAICYKFIELMRGKIWVESIFGIGSTFFFTIPVYPFTSRTIRQGLGELVGKKILVVDDKPSNIMILGDMLTKLGIEYISCTSGESALVNIRNKKFDAAIIDICMPVLDGNSLASRIAILDRSIKLIACSSLHEKVNELNPIFMTHITKPFNRDRLSAILIDIFIKTAVPKKRSRVKNSSIRILVVEDSKPNQQVLVEMLKTLGYRNITLADDGDIAVDMVKASIGKKRCGYDVILMDLKMNKMHGDKAAMEIYKLFKRRRYCPKIIAITANALEESKIHCLKECNMVGYITKPISDLSILSNALKDIRRFRRKRKK